MPRIDIPAIDATTFYADVDYIESLWQRVAIGETDMPLIDVGCDKGEPLVFVPIFEHLEFVYARQIRAFSRTRRVIMYRRHEARTRPVGLVERAEELRQVLDTLGLECVDLVGHGDAAMVLFEFATCYPQRCRSLIIVAQGADYQIAPHPFIWLLHELFVRLPIEYILPAWFLRRIVINYIVANSPLVDRQTPNYPISYPPDNLPARGDPTIMNFDKQNRSGAVTLSAAKGLARWAQRCFAEFTLERSEGLSMTGPALKMKIHNRGSTVQNGTHERYVEKQPQKVSSGVALPRYLIEEQFRKIALWPSVYKYSVLPIIHYFDMRERLASLTMPILLINRATDALSPETKTRWLAEQLPNCAGYHVVPGRERFFMYSQAETVNSLIEEFFTLRNTPARN